MPGAGITQDDKAQKKPQQPLGGLIQNVNQQNDEMLDVSHPASQLSWQPLGNPLPSYGKGGDVPADQTAQLHEGERVLNPVETHAYKSAAIGNAPNTFLGRVADRFHELYAQGKAEASKLAQYPTGTANQEVNEIKAKREQVDALKKQGDEMGQAPPARTYPAPVAADRVNPNARYGVRPGEKRLDPQGNAVDPTTPAGLGTVGPKMPVPTTLGRIPSRNVQEASMLPSFGGGEPEVEKSELEPSEESRRAEGLRDLGSRTHNRMQPAYKVPDEVIPSYQDGGTIPEDQVAKIHEDEHVLDPEKAALYNQAEDEVMNKAPLDHGGMLQREDATKLSTKHYPQPGNPVHVQGDLERPMDAGNGTSTKLSGATMNTDNAPLSKPVMNMQNAAPMADSPVQEASTKQTPLGPQVAPQGTGMRRFPGMPLPEPEAPKEEAPAAPDPMAIVHQDKMDAMKKGDNVALGNALIHENALMPKYAGAGKPVAEGELAPQKDIKLEKQAEGKALYHKTVDDLRQKMLHGETEQIRFQAEKDLANYKLHTPWGGDESAHPGLGGKIGHVLGQIGQTALSASAPYVNEAIPGSQLGLREDAARGEQGVEQAQRKEGTAAETELKKAQAEKAGEPAKVEYGEVPGGAINPKSGNTEPAFYNKSNPQAGIVFGNVETPAKAEKPVTAEQENAAFNGAMAKIAKTGKYNMDPIHNLKNIQAAVKAGDLSADEGAAAVGYLNNPSHQPAQTKIEVSGQENVEKANEKLKHQDVIVQLPNGKSVQMTGEEAQKHGYADFSPISAQTAQKNREAATNASASMTSFTRYQKDFNASVDRLSEEERNGMRAIVEHTTDAANVGGIIAQLPAAGPISTTVNKVVQGQINSEQYRKLSPAAAKLVADYFTAIVSNFANMKQMLGTVGRNPAMLQAEMNTIPKPYLARQEANDQFNNKIQDVRDRNKSIPGMAGKPEGGHTVGERVTQDGQTYTVKEVNADGSIKHAE